MKTMYFVSWYIHNKTEDAWNAIVVDQYDNQSAARKSYHQQLSMYINDPNFDSVAVILNDSFGNTIMSEFWMDYVEPVESEE